MPTQISMLRGIGKNLTAPRKGVMHVKEVGKAGVARKRFINFGRMTEGQLYLYLLDQQLDILESYYNDPLKTYEQGRNMIYQTPAS